MQAILILFADSYEQISLICRVVFMVLGCLLEISTRCWVLMKKRGLNPPLRASCLDFSYSTNANLLTHLPTSGPLYTWHNGRFGMELSGV